MASTFSEYLAFSLVTNEQIMKLYIELDHTYAYKFSAKYFYMLSIAKTSAVRNLEILL
jgi:hypothetical protein